MKNEKIISAAAQQSLSDFLGDDEGKAYYLLLNKQDQELESEFSYSKRYRVMKSLFDSGALGKFKQKDKDFFSYIVLPPCFLYSEDTEIEIIEFLENLYLENHSASLLEDSSQLILSNNKCLLIFMLKYFMKDTAKVTGDSRQLSLEKFIGRKAEKVTLVGKDESKFRGTIDKSISFDFVTIPDLEEKKYIGYISFVEH